jgi:signal transduction histidine kinase
MILMRDNAPMHWQRGVTLAALVLAWALLAAWQWQEYQVEREAAHAAMSRKADSVMKALVGGVQSHRRPGRFGDEPIQNTLNTLVEPQQPQDILAAAVVSDDRRLTLCAGNAELLNLSSPLQTGQYWEPGGYRYVKAMPMLPEPFGPGGPRRGMEPGGPPLDEHAPDEWDRPMRVENRPSAAGTTSGAGGDAGKGTARRGQQGPDAPNWFPRPSDGGPLAAPSRLFAVLVFDRSRVDRQIAEYLWLRITVVVAGGLVILSVALAWRAAVRLAEARGHAQLLDTEARHLRDLSQAAAGLAHETRSPLGLIRGWTQRWAQSMSEADQHRQQAQAVIEECDRVTARINQFLAFARPCQPRITETRPAEVLRELGTLLEPDLDAKRLTLAPVTPLPDYAIQADREMFRQALFNLIQNAVEFAPDGSAIEVSAMVGPGGAVRVEVADRGPGVPAEEVALLFTPYHTTRSSGTGLGLAIVRRIAAAHDWETGYTPRPGGGAAFWLDGIRGGSAP